MKNSNEKRRVQLACQIAINNAIDRIKELDSKDKYALQNEFLEWDSLDTDSYEAIFLDHYNSWSWNESDL